VLESYLSLTPVTAYAEDAHDGNDGHGRVTECVSPFYAYLLDTQLSNLTIRATIRNVQAGVLRRQNARRVRAAYVSSDRRREERLVLLYS
jgi:hypothetical protein